MKRVIFLILFLPFSLFAQEDSIQELDGVDIYAAQSFKLPLLENEYVLDYLLIEDDIVLLSKIKQVYLLRIVTEEFEELKRVVLTQKPESFYTDCMGYHHLLTKDSTYQLYVAQHDVQFLFPHEKESFFKLLSNCVGTTDKGLVYETFLNKNQTHMFIEFDTISGENNLLYISEDWVNYYSLLEDQILWEKDYARAINNLAAMALNFNHLVLSSEPYAPFFSLDTGYVILDHKKSLGIKGNDFESKEIFDIVYHHKDTWADHIIQAENGNLFYAKLIDGGLLMIQNLGTDFKDGGKITNVKKHTFPQQLKIKDGYLYYLARENKEDSYIKLWKVKV